MSRPLGFLPEQASTMAPRVDSLFIFLCVLCGFVGLAIVALIVYFAVRYRHRGGELPPMGGQAIDHQTTRKLEAAWIAVPMVIFLGIFYWGAEIYASMTESPANAMEVFVVGKRWMWKIQHMNGRREINELHIPLGQPVKLLMTSEDVIHSFYVPAFRVKQDVLPGRYSSLWFEPTKVGTYHLFCAEYCGTKHSQMLGSIVVMEPDDFQAWLGGTEAGAVSLAEAGAKRFQDLGCATCHRSDSTARGPELKGLFGRRVKLADGDTVVADEGYIRESILEPRARVVAGFDPIMPTFTTQIDEVGVLELIAYVRSLSSGAPSPAEAAATGSAEPVASTELAPSAEASAASSASAEPLPSGSADASGSAAPAASASARTTASASVPPAPPALPAPPATPQPEDRQP